MVGETVGKRVGYGPFDQDALATGPQSRDSFRWWFFQRPAPAVAAASEFDGGVECRRTAKMARLEAVLFVADGALSTRRLVQLATLADAAEASQLVEMLNAAYDSSDTAFRIERVATGYQMLTRRQFAPWLNKLHQRQSALKLSAPAIETLTIVAYRQPITRADIEAVRGVQCAEMLKQLMDRGLVRIGGADDSLGRPYLYETTRRFLELFGLRSLDDLPMAEKLRRVRSKKTSAQEANLDDFLDEAQEQADPANASRACQNSEAA